jgi:hypothetical protein
MLQILMFLRKRSSELMRRRGGGPDWLRVGPPMARQLTIAVPLAHRPGAMHLPSRLWIETLEVISG